MTPELRKTLYNRCNPGDSLAPDDVRNVAVDDVVDGEARPRGLRWVDELATAIEYSSSPTCQFFTGLPGSGKSTELRRLEQRLSDPSGLANFLVVRVDCEHLLDLTAEVDVPDVLLALLFQSDRSVLVAEGKEPTEALKEGVFASLWRVVTSGRVEDVKLGLEAKASGGVPTVATGEAASKVEFTLRTDPSLRELVRRNATLQFGAFLERIREAFTMLDGRARVAGTNGLVVILDSLEKLQGIHTNWDSVLTSAERLFAGDAPHLRLPVHVIYTVPTALVLRLKLPVQYMPMIKLRGPVHAAAAPAGAEAGRGAVFAPGYRAAEQIIAARIPDDALKLLLGEATFEARRRTIIERSGGYPRELVRILQLLVPVGDLTDTAFERVLAKASQPYIRMIPDDAFDWLAEVSVDKRLPFTEEIRPMVDRMLSNNLVLRYQNDVQWFDLHPAVHTHDKVREAITRLLAARKLAAEPKGAGVTG